MNDKYGECYCGDCISFNKCKSDKGTRINLVSEGCSCFEPNDIAKVDYPILQKWHDSELLDKVAEKIDKALTDDDSTYKDISSEWDKGTFMGCVLAVIEDMKAEVEQ